MIALILWESLLMVASFSHCINITKQDLMMDMFPQEMLFIFEIKLLKK